MHVNHLIVGDILFLTSGEAVCGHKISPRKVLDFAYSTAFMGKRRPNCRTMRFRASLTKPPVAFGDNDVQRLLGAADRLSFRGIFCPWSLLHLFPERVSPNVDSRFKLTRIPSPNPDPCRNHTVTAVLWFGRILGDRSRFDQVPDDVDVDMSFDFG